jgi:hypothetical protein
LTSVRICSLYNSQSGSLPNGLPTSTTFQKGISYLYIASFGSIP